MSLTTPALARSNLNTLLSTVTGLTVLDYEPFGQAQGTFASVFLDGYDANYWQFTIRVYSPIMQGAREVQVALDTHLENIENALSSAWGPVSWNVAFDPELGVLVASWTVTAGREDF